MDKNTPIKPKAPTVNPISDGAAPKFSANSGISGKEMPCLVKWNAKAIRISQMVEKALWPPGVVTITGSQKGSRSRVVFL
jgi:hypothetical protein